MRRGWDARAAACLLLGLAAITAVLGATLSRRAQRRAGTNAVVAAGNRGGDLEGVRLCQRGELVPAGTAAVQLTVVSAQEPGPPGSLVLSRNGHVLDHSTFATAAGNPSADAPISPTARDLDGVEVCVTLGRGSPVAAIVGERVPHVEAVQIGGRLLRHTSLPITYLRAGRESWWSVASTVAARIGRGRGDWGGPWVAWAAAALALAALALAIRAAGRTLVADRAGPSAAPPRGGPLRRVPRIAWTIAAVATLNAVAWSLITPAFEVPDEQTHFAYAQMIGERGRPPAPRREETLAPELQRTLDDLAFGTEAPPVWSPAQQRRLERDLHAGLPRSAGDQAGPAAPEPPLYYALEAVPYSVAHSATLLDRLALMRLVSALLAGATALFAFLFVRECLPRRPWTWTVGALGVALAPTLGFVSGGVNPDALLFPICAALFYALAVAFRRGLTSRLAIGIGAILAIGVVAKINFYGLVPGALLAVALAARASAGGWNREAGRLVATTAAIAAGPYLALSALDALLWDRGFILARTPGEAPAQHGSLASQLSYMWQVYLPRLPGQRVRFPEFSPPYELWLKGFIGKFGWLKVHYASGTYRAGGVVLGAAGALALGTAIRQRAAVRRRAAELAGYGAMAAGLLLLIGLVALRGWAPGIQGAVQGRYLLPLLPLFAAVLALAMRGVGERWGRAVGVALVLACMAWSVYGQLATIAYFYG